MTKLGEYSARICDTYYGGGHPVAFTGSVTTIEAAIADARLALAEHPTATRILIITAERDAYNGCVYENIIDQIDIAA